jgi:ankyrin repeat protein
LHDVALADDVPAEVAEILLTNNADVNATDNEGKTPLNLAVANGHAHLSAMLRLRGGRE